LVPTSTVRVATVHRLGLATAVRGTFHLGWPGVVGRLARIGASSKDGRDETLRKETLVLAASLITALAVVWVITYSILGLNLSARSPSRTRSCP
jgi:hypothetical protein